MAQKHGREREFYRWPKYKTAYLNAFQQMLEVRKERGLLQGVWKMGKTATEVFNWWMEYDLLPGQMDMFEDNE
jgi:phosphoadenosine phosphosulfate reductase